MSQIKRQLGARVMMGIPTLSSARRSEQWNNAINALQMPLGSSLNRFPGPYDMPIADARNELCRAAIANNVQYLVMFSDDVLPPPNCILKMLDKIGTRQRIDADREVNVDMVTGVYWTKTYPPDPYLYNGLLQGAFKDWRVGDFMPVDMAGCDCLMIDVSVLRQMQQPWFSTDWVWEPGQQSSSIATEDFYFFTKARKAGFRLFCDTEIQCAHEDRDTGTLFGLFDDMVQAGGTPTVGLNEDALIADLGSGNNTFPHVFGPRAKIVRFDMRADMKPDVRCDIRRLPESHFGKYDHVLASHVLEHFRREEAVETVTHWCKLLRDGGTLEIHVPNLLTAFHLIQEGLSAGHSPSDINHAWAILYGDQAKPGAAWEHKNGFTPIKLERLLQATGILHPITVDPAWRDNDFNMRAVAIMPKQPEVESIGTWWDEIYAAESTDDVVPDNGKVAEGDGVQASSMEVMNVQH